MKDTFIHPTAIVDDGAVVEPGCRIWHFSHIMGGAVLGECCNIGQNVFIASGVRLGRNVKIQNNVSVYDGVEIEDNVFCGPSCVFTNVLNPRAHFPVHGLYGKTIVREGASLGANCTIVCGHTIGRCALVAAGAVVTEDVRDHALVAGVPARQTGWVCECGKRLDENLKCTCGREYSLDGDNLMRKH